MEHCPRCGDESKLPLNKDEICVHCIEEYEQEMQESMSKMFDAEGNNLGG